MISVASCSDDDGDDSIAPWHQTRWLVLSSWLFCLPAYLAYRKQRADLALLLGTASAISANYWRCARPGWRRTLDLVYGKVAFVTLFGVWAGSLPSSPHAAGLVEASVYVPTTIGLYVLSAHTHRLAPWDHTWWRIHGLFHLCILYGQWRVLHGLPPSP